MIQSLQYKVRICFLLIVYSMILSCKKSDLNTRSINGIITPANAAFIVRAFSTTSKEVISANIDGAGNYIFTNLPLGSYNIQPMAVGGFAQVTAATIDVTRKDSVQNFIIPINNSDGRVSYTINNTKYVLYNPNTFAGYNGSSPSGFTISSKTNGGANEHYQVDLTFAGFNAAASYPAGNTSTFNFSVQYYLNSSIYILSTIKGGDGVVTVSNVDTVYRRISGSFHLKAVPQSSNVNGGYISINDGEFNNLYYSK